MLHKRSTLLIGLLLKMIIHNKGDQENACKTCKCNEINFAELFLFGSFLGGVPKSGHSKMTPHLIHICDT